MEHRGPVPRVLTGFVPPQHQRRVLRPGRGTFADRAGPDAEPADPAAERAPQPRLATGPAARRRRPPRPRDGRDPRVPRRARPRRVDRRTGHRRVQGPAERVLPAPRVHRRDDGAERDPVGSSPLPEDSALRGRAVLPFATAAVRPGRESIVELRAQPAGYVRGRLRPPAGHKASEYEVWSVLDWGAFEAVQRLDPESGQFLHGPLPAGRSCTTSSIRPRTERRKSRAIRPSRYPLAKWSTSTSGPRSRSRSPRPAQAGLCGWIGAA